MAGPWTGLSPRGRITHSWNPGEEYGWFREPMLLLELAEARRPGLLRFVAPRGAWIAAMLAIICGLGALIIKEAAQDPGVFAVIGMSMWTLYTGGWLLLLRRQRLYAGAERLGDGEDRDKIVGLYDLAEITLNGSGPTTRLRLRGSNRAELDLPMGLVEANPALWRLVYEGLWLSAAAGARVDPHTRDRLALPDPTVRGSPHP